MAKSRTHFLCRECGGVQSKWMGKCPDCGAWDALEKYIEQAAPKSEMHTPLGGDWNASGEDRDSAPGAKSGRATPLPEIEAENVSRVSSGIGELDRVLGGGFVPGSAVLLGGDPGIGKSTLLLQAASSLVRAGHRVLYATSEESAFQTKLRAERLTEGDGDDLEDLFVLADINLARIVEQAQKVRPAVMILDSIQMIYRPDQEAAPGSISQLRRCCMDLVHLAKTSGMSVVMVGHVTKDGALAGPKLLEHLVDVVLGFEGDRHHAHRIVRSMKNRFGTTMEVGLFEMTGAGLREVTEILHRQNNGGAMHAGTVLCPAVLGSRCMLVEMQALTATGFLGSAKRKASGIDASRLSMLIAVLEKHGGLRLADQDIFAAVAGGMKVTEPATDLALALAIAGAHGRRGFTEETAAIGEVGLSGEIRPVAQIEQRIREAARQGVRTVLTPVQDSPKIGGSTQVIAVRSIGEACRWLDDLGRREEGDRSAKRAELVSAIQDR